MTVNDAITVDIAAWIRTATRPPIHEERCEIHGVNGPCLVNIRVANQHARLALLTTVGNIVGIVVEQQTFTALREVDDPISVAVGRVLNDRPRTSVGVRIVPPAAVNSVLRAERSAATLRFARNTGGANLTNPAK